MTNNAKHTPESCCLNNCDLAVDDAQACPMHAAAPDLLGALRALSLQANRLDLALDYHGRNAIAMRKREQAALRKAEASARAIIAKATEGV